MRNVVVGDGCLIEDGAVIQSSVLWKHVSVGKGARILENIIGSDARGERGAFLAERAVISDHCSIGTEAVVKANVKVWPHKVVEDGAVLSSSLIWGEKWARSLFGAYGIVGLANLEISPEFAAKVGAASPAPFGRKGAPSPTRASHKASRMINRAIMTGMLSVGVDVHDYGVTPLPVVRYLSRSHGEERGGVHIRKSPFDPSFVDLKFFDDSGLDLPMGLEKNIENLFFREDFVRADIEETGVITFPVGGFDLYIDGFAKSIDARAIKERNYNIVLDYSYGSAAVIFPRILGQLGVETVALNAILDPARITRTQEEFDRGMWHLSAISRSLNADFGAMLDTGGEKIFLVDEKGDILPDATALQVVCLLACRQARQGLGGGPGAAPREGGGGGGRGRGGGTLRHPPRDPADRPAPPQDPLRLGEQGVPHADADGARQGEAEPVHRRREGVRGGGLGAGLPEPGRGVLPPGGRVRGRPRGFAARRGGHRPVRVLGKEAVTDARPPRGLGGGGGRGFLSRLPAPAPPPPDVLVREGDSIPLGNVAFRVLHTPGHTPGHVTYLSGDLAFVGDLIFAGSIGRTDLPGGSLHELLRAVREKIFTLPEETALFPGHGPATTVGEEKRGNPFFTEEDAGG